MSVIAVDFDRVIHDVDHPVAGRRMGPPIDGALEGVLSLVRSGHEVVVFTCRGSVEDRVHVERWLTYWGFPVLRVTNVKETVFDLILDDKAQHFNGWPLGMEAAWAAA